MKIEILKACVTTSHTLKKGDVVNMVSKDAENLIKQKKAKKVK